MKGIAYTLFGDNLQIKNKMKEGQYRKNIKVYFNKRWGKTDDDLDLMISIVWIFDTLRPLHYGFYDYGFELYRLIWAPIWALLWVLIGVGILFTQEPVVGFGITIVAAASLAYSFISALINLFTRPIATLIYRLMGTFDSLVTAQAVNVDNNQNGENRTNTI